MHTPDSQSVCLVISITAHGGIINGLLTAVGRKRYALTTGGLPPFPMRRIAV